MTKDEELLLEIVSNNSFSEYNKCISEEKNKFLIEQLSHIRGNIFEWLQVRNKKVLEINGCYGAVSECLIQTASSLDVIVNDDIQFEISSKRLNRYGNAVVIKQELDDDIQESSYDMVLVANPYYRNESHLVTEIHKYKEHLEDGGRICIAFDNKYGLRYFDGANEPNNNIRFSGIEGYRDYIGIRSFSRQELENALSQVEISSVRWLYPYPDRLLPSVIYSDEYLPKKGELVNNYRSFGNPCMISFDETQAWDNIIGDGLFTQFSNSYLVILEV